MKEWLESLVGKAPADIISKILPPLIMVIVCMAVIKVIMKLVRKGIEKSKLEKGLHTFVEKTIKVILYFITVIIIADMLSIPITSLIATFSVVGLAASLAVQDTLSNLASGITVLVTHPFKTGDFVDVSDVSGTVKEINFTHTVLTTPDNKVIRVPNKDVVNATITNYSENAERQVALTFDVSYNCEMKKVIDVMKSVIDSTPKILMDKNIFTKVTAYKDSSIQYTIKVWAKKEDYWDVYFDLMEKVKLEFDKNSIEIPYNQLDVHVHNV